MVRQPVYAGLERPGACVAVGHPPELVAVAREEIEAAVVGPVPFEGAHEFSGGGAVF